MAVIGDREVADGTVALRRRDGVHVPPLTSAAVLRGLEVLATRRDAGLDLPQ
jgi:hypothetical protein